MGRLEGVATLLDQSGQFPPTTRPPQLEVTAGGGGAGLGASQQGVLWARNDGPLVSPTPSFVAAFALESDPGRREHKGWGALRSRRLFGAMRRRLSMISWQPGVKRMSKPSGPQILQRPKAEALAERTTRAYQGWGSRIWSGSGRWGRQSGRRERGTDLPCRRPHPAWRSFSGSNRRGGRSGQSQRRQSPGRDSQQLWSGPQICSCLLPGRLAQPAPPAPRPAPAAPPLGLQARGP